MNGEYSPTCSFGTQVLLEDESNSTLAVALLAFEVLMPPQLEFIVFHGTFATLDAIEEMLLANASGAYLRFGDGEVIYEFSPGQVGE